MLFRSGAARAHAWRGRADYPAHRGGAPAWLDRRTYRPGGNALFVRVSGCGRDALVGSAHNIIRHPDIPQSVFWLPWQYLEAGKPFAGFVKNMAADGGHYGVTALAAPIPQGYLSVRFKPSTALLPLVDGVYKEMLAIERRAAQGPGAGARACRRPRSAS